MENQAKLIFITGGVRSGKSSYAQRLAHTFGGQVYYIATSIPGDQEMEARVAEHRQRRPKSWKTLEEACNPAPLIMAHDQPGTVFLIDCLTMLVNNLMCRPVSPASEGFVLRRIQELTQTAAAAQGRTIMVSNEVGSGIVPADPLSRAYRDILGRANQMVSQAADEVYLCAAGLAVEVKSRSAFVPYQGNDDGNQIR